MNIKLTRGLTIDLPGAPEQTIVDAPPIERVAVLVDDRLEALPELCVDQGASVRAGQPLFRDSRNRAICFTAPAGGHVEAIHRGDRRRLLSIVVAVDRDERAVEFALVGRDDLGSLDRNFVQHRLLDSGLWPAFRSRPFDRIPPPDDIPAAILVTAIDTNPLAADPVTVIAPRMDAFIDGLHVLGKLTSRLCLCKAHGLRLDSAGLPKIEIVEFSGPHPAGLPGTHVACLAPASEVHSVWHLGYQDVIAIGEHFVSGRIPTERVVAVGGPGALQPRLLRTRVGAALDELLAGAIAPAARVIAGSLLSGREPEPMTAFLGPYETQVSVLKKDADDIVPAAGRVTKFFESVFGTSSVMMPLERFERLWPLPHPVLPLLRALLTGDVDRAAELGCLDLAEEDLALCSYLCPGRQDYGTALRKVLRELESDLLD